MTPKKTEKDVPVGKEPAAAPAWRNRAVERSLERSRVEAERRSARFVDTALELVEETGGKDFTVQDVVDKMRVSTRTFYQYFSGKDELLVAMFEEAQRHQNKELRRMVAVEPDPFARLQTFVLGSLQRAHDGRGQSGSSRLLVQQYFRLQQSHPDELSHSYKALVTYLSEIVADAAAAGRIRSVDHERTAAILLQMITTANQASIIGSPLMDPPLSPAEVWEFCLSGIGMDSAGRESADREAASDRHDLAATSGPVAAP
ncbi:TetR/AcrR family transcriptional regulator [Frankia gtarii]|uniref:TetR/AcrR family transcriptional regulator n=1 Tax=Frankia gtarii TaxID=2950102 RepID=UPI0021BFD2E8|nr:TetR/AcrR family transcriptional regulator [Frankia gtarii]